MQAAALYGIHFRGIETEFDFFARLVEFYESVHETFATLEQKPLRDFLLLGDAEILSQVPVLDAYPEGVQLKLIEENIGRLEALAAAREQACNRVRELAKIFDASAKVETHTLSTLKGAVARCLSERQRLDGDVQMSALLGAYFEGSSTNAAALQGLASLAKAIAALGAGGRGVASLIAAGQANAVLKLARELDETFVASESIARKLNGMTGLDAKSVLNKGTFVERASALHQAAQDLDGLYAHAEFAGVKEDFDPALHEYDRRLCRVEG